MSKGGLIIFIKNPKLGKVKTRLAASIGAEQALAVYTKLLAHTQEVAKSADCNNYLFYDQKVEHNDDWSVLSFSKEVQAKGDLGARIEAAFSKVLSKEDRAIIIGSDCPEISAELIDEAFSKLAVADVVIGPAHDGGYYLLGLKSEQGFLFQDMPWSTEDVCSITIDRIKEKQLLYTLLPTLSDLDNKEDLDNFPAFKV